MGVKVAHAAPGADALAEIFAVNMTGIPSRPGRAANVAVNDRLADCAFMLTTMSALGDRVSRAWLPAIVPARSKRKLALGIFRRRR